MHNKIIEKILLNFFLFASFFLGGLILGPFSIRIYAAIIILLYLIFAGYKFPFSREVNLYIIFILIYIYALFGNGEFYETDFLKIFLGRYFICFIAYFTILSLIKTRKSLYNTIFFICLLGLVNSIVSILQFLGNNFAIFLSNYFNPVLAAQGRIESLSRFSEGNIEGIGAFGLFSSSVSNGYFTVIPCVLILFLIENARNFTIKFIYIILSFIFIISLFVVQQRLVMVLTLLFYVFYFIRKFKKLAPLVLIFSIFIFYILSYNINIDSENLGRFQSFEDKQRESLFTISFNFVQDNFLFGGEKRLGNLLIASGMNVTSSHNFILNAFIYSGVFGALILIYLYLIMLFKALREIYNNYYPQTFIAVTLLIFLLNSLTHNRSLVTGDETIWILYGLLYISNKLGKNENIMLYR